MSTANQQLLSTVEAAARLGISSSTLYRFVGDDDFPQPIKIGARTKFYAFEIDQWLGPICPGASGGT